MRLYRLQRKGSRLTGACCAFVVAAPSSSAARSYVQAHATDRDTQGLITARDWRESSRTACTHIGATYIPHFCEAGTILLVDFHYGA